MSLRNRCTAIFLLLALNACGLFSDQPPDPTENAHTDTGTPTPPLSKEVGLSCLGQGDVGCAKRNFCALQGDPKTGLRCCLANFLEVYFSDNTKALAEDLGYAPLPFAELRKLSRQEIVEKKSVLFGELFLLPEGEAPSVGEAAKEWGKSLVLKQAAVATLQERLGKFGEGLGSVSTCLEKVNAQLKEDEIEKEIFGSGESLKISSRDLYFLQFGLATGAYLFQALSHYDLGFAQFPPLPLSDAFLADLNGQAGAGDGRFGSLTAEGAEAVAKHFPLLTRAFAALKSFALLKGTPSRVDDYLDWRANAERQEDVSHWLKAMHESMETQEWVEVEGEDEQVNLSHLGAAALLPNSQKLALEAVALERDAAGEVVKNELFFDLLLWNEVKPIYHPDATPLP